MSRRADGGDARSRCSISLVIPLFRVEAYLPELLASLSAQEPGDYDLEVIFVDDGSPDRSGDLAQAWLETSGTAGSLIRQENQGVSAARNRGLDAATGDLVSFPDSDDVLDPAYCASIGRFVSSADNTARVLVTNILRLDEHTGRVRDSHALRSRFAKGSRVVRLADHPDIFQLQAATSFFRRSDLVASGVRFQVGLHASEDALFVADFLVRDADPKLGLVAEAKYLYRKRMSRDSAVDTYRARPDTYTTRFEDGYLPLLREVARRAGAAPGWLQSVLLYEYKWLIEAQADPLRYARVLDDAQRRRVIEITRACLEFVSAERIIAYSATPLSVELRMLLIALKGMSLPAWLPVVADRVDTERGVQRLRVYATAEVAAPSLDGAAPIDRKIRVPDYFGQETLVEHVLWVPHGSDPVIRINGVERPVERLDGPWAIPAALDAHRRVAMSTLSHASQGERDSRVSQIRGIRRRYVSKETIVRALARVPWVGWRFAGAWFAVAAGSESDDRLIAAVQAAAQASGKRFAVVGAARPGIPTVTPGSRAVRVALARAGAVVVAEAGAWTALSGVARRKRDWLAVALLAADSLEDSALSVALEAMQVDGVVLESRADPALLTADGSATALTAPEVWLAPPGDEVDVLVRVLNRRV